MGKRKPEREVSAGGIVFRRDESGVIRFLLIKDSYDNWGFPKGHLEENESPAARPVSRDSNCTAPSGSSTGISAFAAGSFISIATFFCSSR